MSSLLELVPGIDRAPDAVVVTASWGVVLAGVALAYVVSRFVVVRLLDGITARTPTAWDKRLLRHRVPHRLSLIPSGIVLYLTVPLVPGISPTVQLGLQRLATAVIVVSFAAALFAALGVVNEIYEQHDYAAERPIKSYLQLVKLVIAIVAAILIVATVAGLSPILLLSGLGAATAVLMLIFQNTILSLVASVQLTTNDMLRVGDWIEMPSHGADGDVIDIALHTVKVRNWDMTVVTVPTHRLISESFVNWRGMSESGGRRIKRAINVDVTSIRFLTDDELDHFATWPRLTAHIAAKRAELHVEEGGHDPSAAATGAARRLTNIGVFRAYCERYLRDRGDIHTERMTLLVRQLAATSEGVPLELYAFTTDTGWVAYENIQSDIFDHVFAIMGYFGLRPYQRPSSADVSGLRDRDDGDDRAAAAGRAAAASIE